MTPLKREINYIPCERRVLLPVQYKYSFVPSGPLKHVTNSVYNLAPNGRICVGYNECARSTYRVLKIFCLLL